MTQNMQASGCPFHQKDGGQTSLASTNNSDWWPNALNLDILSQQDKKTNPMDPDFDYAAAFKSLDLEAVKQDLRELINSSQEWWPSDYGSYIGMFVRTMSRGIIRFVGLKEGPPISRPSPTMSGPLSIGTPEPLKRRPKSWSENETCMSRCRTL